MCKFARFDYSQDYRFTKFKEILRMQKVPIQILIGCFYILKRNLNLQFTRYKFIAIFLVEEVCKYFENVKCKFKEILRMQKVPIQILIGCFYILKRNLNYAKYNLQVFENFLYEEYFKIMSIVKCKFKKILRMQKEPLENLIGCFYILKRNLSET